MYRALQCTPRASTLLRSFSASTSVCANASVTKAAGFPPRENSSKANGRQMSSRSKSAKANNFPSRQESIQILRSRDYQKLGDMTYGQFVNHLTSEGVKASPKDRRAVMSHMSEKQNDHSR